jgi:peptidoglycan hydrolase-like protein with peptidoglycan-binding domain
MQSSIVSFSGLRIALVLVFISFIISPFFAQANVAGLGSASSEKMPCVSPTHTGTSKSGNVYGGGNSNSPYADSGSYLSDTGTSKVGNVSVGGNSNSPYADSGRYLSDTGTSKVGNVYGGGNSNSPYVGECDESLSNSSKRTSPQNTIASLLARIKALNEQIENGTSPIRDVRPNEGRSCLAITRSLAFGSVDGATADVTALQTILTKTGHYTGEITGYFGQKTKAAVQAFQKAEGIASAGDEESTGYGMVGEKTRAALKKHCATTPTSPTTPVGATYTLAEVATVTYTSTTVGGLTPGHKKFKYIITLKDGTKREFEHVGKNVNPKRASLEDLVEKTGYTGDVVDLLKMARKVETPVNNNILSY